MGCSPSSDAIELLDMAEKCRIPSVQFREEYMEINKSKRNTAVWLPLDGYDIKGVVLISHGLGEHALCYYHIAHELVSKGYAVYGIDHVSHGKSEGRRGVIPSHEILVQDFIYFVNTIRQQYQDLPAFVVAHSMGTLVALKSLRSLENISAIALSGPAIFAGHAASSPFGVKSLYPLSQTSFAVGLTAVTSTLDPAGPCAPVVIEEITANAAVLADMKRDPRRNESFVTNKTAKELIQLIRLVKEEVPKITLPIYCIHGELDMIALKKSSEFVFENVGTSAENKHLMIMKNLKHEVFNEPEPHGKESIMLVVNFIENEFNKHMTMKKVSPSDVQLVGNSAVASESKTETLPQEDVVGHPTPVAIVEEAKSETVEDAVITNADVEKVDGEAVSTGEASMTPIESNNGSVAVNEVEAKETVLDNAETKETSIANDDIQVEISN